MIAIIDYDAGNIKSVEKALKTLGQDVVITRDADVILSADKVILPGVGAFGDAMGKLHDYGLVEVIHKVVEKKTPFLGICLGLQLMFESSEETPGVEGLSILKGKIVKIPENGELRIWDGILFIFRMKEDCLLIYRRILMCISFILTICRRKRSRL